MSKSFVARSASPTRHRFNRAWLYVFAALLIGESAGCGDGHTPPAGPSAVLTLRAIQPSTGPAGVATTIGISGAAFKPETILTIDGVVTKAAYVSSVWMTAIAPAHEAGAVDVAVRNPDGGTSTLAGGFRYLGLAVTAVTPSVGSTAGGTGVQLNGTSFQNGVVASIDGVAQQTYFGNSSFVALKTTPHAAGPVDILITNPDGKTTLVSGKYSFALPQSLDFNGSWVAYREGSEDVLFRFTIQNNALISITCGSSTPIVFSPPPSVANGEFSFTGTIGSLSGRILAAGQANGTIDVPGCGSGVWFAGK